MMQAKARPIPVFPEVPSITVPPGFKIPAFSASSIIFTAIRSFTELPGLVVSTFAKTKAGISFVSLLILMSGVFPIVSSTLLKIRMQEVLTKLAIKGTYRVDKNP